MASSDADRYFAYEARLASFQKTTKKRGSTAGGRGKALNWPHKQITHERVRAPTPSPYTLSLILTPRRSLPRPVSTSTRAPTAPTMLFVTFATKASTAGRPATTPSSSTSTTCLAAAGPSWLPSRPRSVTIAGKTQTRTTYSMRARPRLVADGRTRERRGGSARPSR